MKREEIFALIERIQAVCPPECKVETVPTKQPNDVHLIIIQRPATDFDEVTETSDTQVEEYKSFFERNLVLRKVYFWELQKIRRWHYDHPQEYADFIALFQKAYDGDMTFIQNNFFFLIEMLSLNGVGGMMNVVASLFPGNKHYEQSLMRTDDNPLKGRLAEMLDSSLNNDAVRKRLLHENPYLFSLYYWIIFDNGYLHAADLISQTFLKPESTYWEKQIGRRCVEVIIGASIDKARYSKAQWKEVTQKLEKGETKQVIEATLLEVQGRRGRKSTFVLLPFPVHMIFPALIFLTLNEG